MYKQAILNQYATPVRTVGGDSLWIPYTLSLLYNKPSGTWRVEG